MLGFTDLFNLRQVQQTRNVGRNVNRINRSPGRLQSAMLFFYLSIADSPAVTAGNGNLFFFCTCACTCQ